MRDLLRSSLSRSLSTLPDDDRLAAAWPVACGPALAARGRVLGLSPAIILEVAVTDPAWMDQFIDMRSTLLRDLARIAGVQLSGIHFQHAGRPRPSPTSLSHPKR